MLEWTNSALIPPILSYSWARFAAKLCQQPLPQPLEAFALKQLMPARKWNW